MKMPWGEKLAPVKTKPKAVVQKSPPKPKAKARAQQVGIKDEIDRLLYEAAVEYESTPPHRKFFEWREQQDSYSGAMTEKLVAAPRSIADLISSETAEGNHAPLIDLDFPCRLYPSGTEGHFHLYLDKEISWDKFLPLLKAFVDADLVEFQYYEMAKKRKASFLRLPEKPKTDNDRFREQEKARAQLRAGASKGSWY